MNIYPTDILEVSEDGVSVIQVDTHDYSNADGETKASAWLRANADDDDTPAPRATRGLGTTDGIAMVHPDHGHQDGSTCVGSLGYFMCHSNNIKDNAKYVGLFTVPCTHGHGINILAKNIDRVMALNAARRLVEPTAFTERDNYFAPDTTHPKWLEFVADAYVFGLVDNQSYQTSIKGECYGVDYNIVNEFYPFSKADTYDMLGLEKKTNFKDELRFCLENNKFLTSGENTQPSAESTRVLEALKRCIRDTAAVRKEYDTNHPELQVKRWDAGYRQLKGLFEESAPDAFAELKAALKALKAKMLPLVYELGFLRK